MSRMLLAKSLPKCLEYTSENCKYAHLGDGFVDSDFDRIFLQITLEPIETFSKPMNYCIPFLVIVKVKHLIIF